MENQNIPVEKVSAWYNNAPLAILIAAAMVSGSILYAGGSGTARLAQAPTDQGAGQVASPTPVQNPADLVAANDPVIGNSKAKVTIVEFSDFQCPYCRAFYKDTYSQLKKDYIDTGKVKLVFRDYPLPFHPSAQPAALGGQCATEQGKFWQYHDMVFGEQQKREADPTRVAATITFSANDLKAWAAKAGLNAAQFNSCLDSAKYKDNVQADTDAGNKYGVSGTPSFFVNGQLLVGAQPYSEFKKLIDQALN
jgi:protein-disulfide isomerase